MFIPFLRFVEEQDFAAVAGVDVSEDVHEQPHAPDFCEELLVSETVEVGVEAWRAVRDEDVCIGGTVLDHFVALELLLLLLLAY